MGKLILVLFLAILCILQIATARRFSESSEESAESESKEDTKLLKCRCSHRDDRRICGNDGKTYRNVCLYKCEKRKNEQLKRVRCFEKSSAESFSLAPPRGNARKERPRPQSPGTRTRPSVFGVTASPEKSYGRPSYTNLSSNTSSGYRRNFLACVCPKKYVPVCGANGKTYANECKANCKRVEIVRGGSCDSEQSGRPYRRAEPIEAFEETHHRKPAGQELSPDSENTDDAKRPEDKSDVFRSRRQDVDANQSSIASVVKKSDTENRQIRESESANVPAAPIAVSQPK